MGRATSLRNLLGHDYIAVDLATLAHVVAHHLGDLREFGGAIGGLLPSVADPA